VQLLEPDTPRLVATTGDLGVFVEDGTARFSDMSLRALQPPEFCMPAEPVQEIM